MAAGKRCCSLKFCCCLSGSGWPEEFGKNSAKKWPNTFFAKMNAQPQLRTTVAKMWSASENFKKTSQSKRLQIGQKSGHSDQDEKKLQCFFPGAEMGGKSRNYFETIFISFCET
jgi:hypothetical protein